MRSTRWATRVAMHRIQPPRQSGSLEMISVQMKAFSISTDCCGAIDPSVCSTAIARQYMCIHFVRGVSRALCSPEEGRHRGRGRGGGVWVSERARVCALYLNVVCVCGAPARLIGRRASRFGPTSVRGASGWARGSLSIYEVSTRPSSAPLAQTKDARSASERARWVLARGRASTMTRLPFGLFAGIVFILWSNLFTRVF